MVDVVVVVVIGAVVFCVFAFLPNGIPYAVRPHATRPPGPLVRTCSSYVESRE